MTLKSLLASALALGAVSAQAADSEWYRNPAVSPDGSKVAFSHHGDIYVVSSNGGTATALTSHSAYDSYPVWSRDGKQLAFASKRYGNYDIFTVPASGGQPTRLTFHSSNDIPSDFSADGSSVLFTSLRMDSAQSTQFPSGRLEETYSVNLAGGTPRQVTTIVAEKARYNRAGDKFLYQDKKGYEDQFRKRHRSSVTRDIWLYDTKSGKYSQQTHWLGEDRNPIWSNDEQSFFFTSERSGTMNVWQQNLASGEATQVTDHKHHPVRFLSADNNGNLVYGYHGSIYRLTGNSEPQKLNISIRNDFQVNPVQRAVSGNGASEFAVSPNGKEVALVLRGDVYVTSTEFPTTRRLTNTPGLERSVSFSPDGRSVLYAGERDGSWNLYATSLVEKDQKYFNNALKLQEKVLLANAEETFQPTYSPDGKEIAYLSNRDTLKVLNLKSGKSRTVLAEKYNYSYSDGDIRFAWSPDNKWIATSFIDGRWITEIGLVDASGKKDPVNLTVSGYADAAPTWAMDGNAIVYASARHGRRNHGSWGSEMDLYGIFLNQDSWDKFRLTKEEYALKKEAKNGDKKDDKGDKKKDKKKGAKKDKKPETKTIDIDLANIEDRRARLTRHASDLAGGALSKDGRKLYYLAKFEKGYDLWVQDYDENSTKLLRKMNAGSAAMTMTKDGKSLFVIADGSIQKITLGNGKPKPVAYQAEIEVDGAAERREMFEHAWRQTREKFYVKDMHGVDWDFYKKEYLPKLDNLSNNQDFADVLSEMLGELNASHTGATYRPRPTPQSDNTAALGIIPDYSYTGNGIKIAEIINKGPLLTKDNKIKPGMIITTINGEVINTNSNYYAMLNHKAGKRVLLTVNNPKAGKKEPSNFEQSVKAISFKDESGLRYQRWVENRRALVDKLSKGKLGYVHVQGMNTPSFQNTYSDVLGRHVNKDALIVDTRFNGGGWLHDDLNTLLSGKKYFDFFPRGRRIGSEPLVKWYKPSAVIAGEGNYSDAYLFPHSYQLLGIGPVIGMPVPATGTAVWWETMMGDVRFGIPQVGMLDTNGNLQENRDLVPDHLINNDPYSIANGRDPQIEKAVKVLLETVK
ncbi:S41 family peptidase [Porticoccus sp. W117]|uniref:S41 family peptidase n=1 Tax=Porticoccus sp. W117 TaxID=3054777 RepID=UPI0025986327|nr:S41 family peptidase [Porticoccus sp. W117]MDM3870505.1 S41 family peptidase [Porticoccus sp. W117]